jgi:putative DNA primase/helicase
VSFILHGREATMKSTFLSTLMATMGDYAMAVDPEVFLARTHVGGPRDDVAAMEGARLVVCAEFDRGRKLAEALLKQLTGGDRVRARHLYQSAREFTFAAKIIFHTNHVPAMNDDDGAVWRRAWVVPFVHSVPEGKRDPSVKARLCDPATSGSAVLAWAVQGCLAWQKHGLGKPPAVVRATQAVRRSMDPLSKFFDDCCLDEPGVWTPSSALREAYEHWCHDNRCRPVGLREWGRRLGERGLRSEKHQRARGWSGVRLIDAETVSTALDLDVDDTCDASGTVSGTASSLGDKRSD